LRNELSTDQKEKVEAWFSIIPRISRLVIAPPIPFSTSLSGLLADILGASTDLINFSVVERSWTVGEV
jgi:hypothetical protein